jgi:hypothetical protein
MGCVAFCENAVSLVNSKYQGGNSLATASSKRTDKPNSKKQVKILPQPINTSEGEDEEEKFSGVDD